MTINREAMQKALDAGDMHRLRRLASENITSLGDRATTDVHHFTAKAMSKHGYQPPPKGATIIKRELIDAAITLDEFMRSYQMEVSSNNRQIIIDIVAEQTIEFVRYMEDGVPDTKEAERIAKLPMYKKVFVNLSSIERIAYNMNRALPGYLQSGMLHFAGIRYATQTPQDAPGITAEHHKQSVVIKHEDDPETEADRKEFKIARAEVKQQEQRKERLRSSRYNPSPEYNPQPLEGLNPDGSIKV